MINSKQRNVNKNCNTVGSIEPTENKMDRKEYLRIWRLKNRDKIRLHKLKYYWKFPEKHRKRARETWHKNKGSTTKGKTVNIGANRYPRLNLSPTQWFRTSFIMKHSSEEIISKCDKGQLSIWKAYNLVKLERRRFEIEIVKLAIKKGGLEHLEINECIKIRKKYPSLKPLNTN